MTEFIKELRAIAMKNYSNGGDFLIECWGQGEWETFITDCARYGRDAVTCLYELMGLHDAIQTDIENA